MPANIKIWKFFDIQYTLIAKDSFQWNGISDNLKMYEVILKWVNFSVWIITEGFTTNVVLVYCAFDICDYSMTFH